MNLKNKDIIKEIYDKKIATCIEEFYKQGFKDGVNLIINCLGQKSHEM